MSSLVNGLTLAASAAVFSRSSLRSLAFSYQFSHRSVTTHSEAENSDHLSFSLIASAGGSLLGANTSGKYDQAVDNNRDVRGLRLPGGCS